MAERIVENEVALAPREQARARLFRSILLAVLLVTAAGALRGALQPVFGEQMPFLFFVIAGTAAAWYGGLWSGAIAMVLGLIVACAWFCNPLEGATKALQTASFAVVAGMVVGVCESLHRARRRAERIAHAVLDQRQRASFEEGSRRIAEEALIRQNRRVQILYQLSDALNRATTVDDMCALAMQGLIDTVRADRTAVLLFDDDQVMRFKAWRGLSDTYRAAVEGHSPWKPADADALPVAVGDVLTDESLAAFRSTIVGEGIRALAFIPLIGAGRVLGKIMVYYNQPHLFTDDELALCRAIAGKIAHSINRACADHALRESEERLRLATQAGKVGVWDWDIVHNRVTWSESLFLILGVKPQEFAGTAEAFERVVHPEDLPQVRQAIQRTFDDDSTYEIEFRAVKADGEIRWLFTQASLMRDDQRRPIRLMGATLDITDRKRFEEELNRHSHRLEELVNDRTAELEATHYRLRLAERMAAIGTLSAGLGHDMGNLLLPLRARLDALERAELPAELREHVTAIGSCAEYLQKLTQGLRQFALDASAWSQNETTDLKDWQRQVEPFYRNAVPRNIQLQWQLPATPLWVKVARHALTQAVYNLVQNAGEAMQGRQRGCVCIAVEIVDDHWLRLIVRDDGPGMSPEVRKRCMEPFYTTKTRGLSTGLGLSLVHGVAKQAGGSLEVQSEPGLGTTFMLDLPQAETTVASPSRPIALVEIASRRVQSFLSQALISMGFEIAESDGALMRCPAVLIAEAGHNGHALERARDFIIGGENRQALIIGEVDAEQDDGRIRVVHSSAKPSHIIQELRALAQRHAGS